MSDTEQGERVDPRFVLAAERTLLAWIRTALAMMGFGFVVARFGLFLRQIEAPTLQHRPGAVSVWVGTALVIAGVAASIAGVWDHRRVVRALREAAPIDTRFQPAAAIAFVLAVIGTGLAAYLIVTR